MKPKVLVGALLMFAAPFFVGCPKAPLSYKLQRRGTTTVLISPSLRSTDEKSSQLVSKLKNARRRSVAGTRIEGLLQFNGCPANQACSGRTISPATVHRLSL